jgi:hypothetical protein
MITKFISINEAVTRYKISQTKLRKIVKDNQETKHIQKVAITGRYGFKYLISVQYLDSLFNVVTEPKNKPKQEFSQDNQNERLIKQLQQSNYQLSDTITSQQTTIKDLTTTLQDQQKIVIAQSLQISRLSEPQMERPNERTTAPNHIEFENSKVGPDNNKKTVTIELLIITVLVVCIVFVIAYLFKI